jgi:AraC-like DNA-binding protein
LTFDDSFLTSRATGARLTVVRELVRASALLNFAELVKELGGDPAPLLSAAHLRPDLLGNAEAHIPLRTVSGLLERAAAELSCPDFALRLSAMQQIDILGPIALIARHSPTAAAAIHGIAHYMPAYSPALKLDLADHRNGRSRFRFTVAAAMPANTQIQELGVGVSYGVFRLLVGPGFRPTEVAFAHAPVSAPVTYRAFFGCPVRFDAEYCGFDLASADLVRARPRSNRQIRSIVARYLENTTDLADRGLPAQVRDLVLRMLPAGQASWANVAAHLGVNGRTLQRWLAAEGTTFEALLDEVRRERAEHYLAHSRLSLGQIATMLGYSQQSCLSRSAVRWFGAAPRQVRQGSRMWRTAADPGANEGTWRGSVAAVLPAGPAHRSPTVQHPRGRNALDGGPLSG